MLFILSGIYLGVVTPTEAAAVGCAAAIVLGLAFRELDGASIRRALKNAVNTNAMLMFIIIGAQTLTFAIVQAGIAREVTSHLVASGLAATAFSVRIPAGEGSTLKHVARYMPRSAEFITIQRREDDHRGRTRAIHRRFELSIAVFQ